MFCFQIGAAVAKHLFSAVGAAGTAAQRLGIASLILIAVWRPWRVRPSLREALVIVAYGLSLGAMNFCFYCSLSRIPLGIAVALEFTGPLALAVAASRRVLDFVWILLAAAGLVVLLPFGFEPAALDPRGVLLALAAGVLWALYIVFGKKAGNAHGGQTAALGMLVGALVFVPIGWLHAGSALISPSILPAAIVMAVLSSALPYSLEMYALPRLPTRTFGVLMSGDPALGALSGLLFLGESLSLVQWAAILSIMVASAGSAATAGGGDRPAPSLAE